VVTKEAVNGKEVSLPTGEVIPFEYGQLKQTREDYVRDKRIISLSLDTLDLAIRMCPGGTTDQLRQLAEVKEWRNRNGETVIVQRLAVDTADGRQRVVFSVGDDWHTIPVGDWFEAVSWPGGKRSRFVPVTGD
jgi:hypothetical protein